MYRLTSEIDWDILPKRFSYMIPVSAEMIPGFDQEDKVESFTWCRTHFGLEYLISVDNKFVINEYARWDCDNNLYCFREESDAMLFKLVWGGESVTPD